MANMGYVNFLGIDCVYSEDNGVFEVLAKDSEQNKEFIPHFEDRNFFFEYVQRYNQRRCAFIESARHFIGGGMELKAKYIVENPRDEAISHMEILGDDIDEFFDPSRYFFTLLNKDSGTIGNVVYNSNKADEWKMVFEGKDIKISLVYGDILKKGVGSDLKLHPRLNLSFPATTDYSFLYRLYLVIVRFMQIVFYRQAHGKYEINLYASLHNGNISYAGKLIDYAKSETVNENGAREINYNNYKDYMIKLLQFSADNQNLNLTHFPRSISRYRGKDYTQLDFISIFSAFECECTAKKEIYEKVNDQPIANIRAKLLKKIGECNGENEEEKKFIALVSDKITQLGTQFGQKKENYCSLLYLVWSNDKLY